AIDEVHPALLENPIHRRIEALPLGAQPLQRVCAFGREAIEPLVPFVFFAPLADQQTLALETPEQRIQRALVDRQAEVRERLAKCIAVVLGFELRENRQNQATAP